MRQTFGLPGLTHFVGRSRKGRLVVGGKTEGKRIRTKLEGLNERLRQLRSQGGHAMMDSVRRHLQGHLRYHGVRGHRRALGRYVYAASRLPYTWLNRRSQRRSISWERFSPVLERWLPTPRNVHRRYPVPK